MRTLLLATMLLALASCGRTGGTGAAGPKGDTGAPGRDGQNCSVSKSGNSTVISCPDGSVAVVNDGVTVTPIKLCPGETVYPSVFVEYAWCVDNKLYGVYSANNGFGSYFPPGNYNSNAIGSSCGLTVGPNCTITH